MLPDTELRKIFAHCIIELALVQAGDKLNGCGAVGVVIQLDSEEKSYIFKYELETQNYGLIEIKFGSLKPNSIIFYHENDEDVAVNAALHGDGIIDEEELKI